jgi:predicted PurR-regulated permease PerM
MNVPIGHAGLTKADNPNAAVVPAEAATESNAGQQPRTVHLSSSVRVSLIGIFIILLTGALYFGKEILLPIALAFMLTLTLSPVVRYLAKFRIPEVVSALVIVLAVVGSTAVGIYYLSGPVSGWIDGAPQTGRQIRSKIESMRAPVDAAVNASKQVEEITSGGSDPTVQKVVVQQPGLLARAAGGAVSLGSTAGITIVLLFFLLASGKLFYEKLVRILPTMTEKKRAIRVVYAVEEEVSAYLLTISAINAALGVVISAVMWALGMPNPILWGVMAAALNFVPYVGALVGAAVVAVVALVSFDTPGAALLPPVLYFVCTTIEGQFITPALLGKRLEMNTVVVFLSVAVWGWLWGVLGALMAVPLLVSLRVLCDHFESLSSLGEFLGGKVPEEPEPADGESTRQ